MSSTIATFGRYVLPLTALTLCAFGALYVIERIGDNVLVLNTLLLLAGIVGFNCVHNLEERLKAEAELRTQKSNVEKLEDVLRDLSQEGGLPQKYRERWRRIKTNPEII